MKIKPIIYFFLIGIAASLYSCNDDRGPQTTAENDVVLTEYDESGNFNSARTVLIVPYVSELDDNGLSKVIPKTGSLDEVILSTTKDNLEDRGYSVTYDTTEIVDLVVTSYKIKTWNVAYVDSWYDWWGDYWGYNSWWYGYYPGYSDGYYPWYGYPYSVSYAYQTGSVFIEIVDNRVVNTPLTAEPSIKPNERPHLWTGVANGIATTTTDENIRMTNAINQMFIQSPYIISISTR